MDLKRIAKLIKIAQKQLDDLQLEKANLINQVNTLEKAEKDLIAEKERELKIISANLNLPIDNQPFYKKLKVHEARIKNDIQALQEEINIVDEKLIEAFKEQRKFEILKEQVIQKMNEVERAQETKLFDEMNIFKSAKETII
jgi:flagellar biosynthesis chaperone FliJ